MNFASDTTAPVHPKILSALAKANDGYSASYGEDEWSRAARDALAGVFETDLDVWLVASGTASNALALSVLCPPTGAIACHREAHIERDERGAPEFFTGGGKLALLDGDHGRIDFGALERAVVANNPDFVHETPLHALSLSNLTECGTAYSAEDLRARAALAHAHGLRVHLDGARFANAVASLGASPADLSWRAGVDVLSFGASKNGAIGCEAIVLFGEAREAFAGLKVRAKRAGHMPAKLRFTAAQMCAYLEDGLWLELAGVANKAAAKLAASLEQACGAELAHPLDGNQLFVSLPQPVQQRLSEAGARFYPWLDGSCRFVCSWSTTDEDIHSLAEIARKS
ncbi:MAG: beta-eliminating lyase-related protein [Hyphomonadaceae bacterium]